MSSRRKILDDDWSRDSCWNQATAAAVKGQLADACVAETGGGVWDEWEGKQKERWMRWRLWNWMQSRVDVKSEILFQKKGERARTIDTLVLTWPLPP